MRKAELIDVDDADGEGRGKEGGERDYLHEGMLLFFDINYHCDGLSSASFSLCLPSRSEVCISAGGAGPASVHLLCHLQVGEERVDGSPDPPTDTQHL